MKAIIILLSLVIILSSALGYLYYKYELPNRNSLKGMANITISAEYNNKKIETGYIIETVDGNINGTTTKSYQLEKVRKFQQIKIYNTNLDDQKFYKDIRHINISEDTHRIDLELFEAKEINVRTLSKKPIKIEIESEYAKNITMCLKWSLNYIFVKAINLTESPKPIGYENWDRCYKINEPLIKSKKEIEINYLEFSNPGANDYIQGSFIQDEFLGKFDKVERFI